MRIIFKDMNNIYILLIQYWNMIIYLSWTEIRSRYVRSVIGPFWIVLTTAISVVGLSYIWSILFNLDRETFIPSLTVGIVIWQFIAACISEAPSCFTIYGSIIRNYSHPIWIYPAALVIKNFIIFLHNLVIVVFVLLIYPQDIGWKTLIIFPTMLLIIVVLIQIVIILSFIGTRYKDFGSAVIALMSIAFFLSPAVFKPDQLGAKEYLMWFNPFSYLITLIRDPLTGHASESFVYFVTLFFVFFASGFVYWLIKRYSFRAVFWI